MQYRAEIDGLRAVAVIPVILFHAGFSPFSGGFVGVDVFFVISGYLITTIILDELEQGTFNVLNFYERRARRILPALFFVLLACLPFAWLWLPPQDIKNFSQSLVAVSFFASNILFWLTSGYFDTAAELKPLLHTWSLAVEEQYYLIFPVFLMATWRFGKSWILASMAIVCITSLAIAQWASTAKPAAAFYLLPTRGWELLIGAFVAFYFSKYKNNNSKQSSNEAGGFIGILLLTYAIFIFDKNTPYPSLYTLTPVIGTTLIILCTNQRTMIGRLLGSQSFVGLGLISYSAYLWHQPLFAFARNRNFEEPNNFVLSALALITIALAYLSWKYVETPFRSKHRFTRKQVFSFGAVSSTCIIALGLAGSISKGFRDLKMTDEVISVLSSAKPSPRRKDCHMGEADYRKVSDACEYQEGVLKWATFGDSHTVELAYALSGYLKEHGEKLKHFSFSGCAPFFGRNVEGNDRLCSDWTNKAVKYIVENKNIENVVVSYRINAALFGGHEGKYPNFPNEHSEKEMEDIWHSYINVVRYFSEHGKNVTLVLQAPELPKPIEFMVMKTRNPSESFEGVSKDWWSKRNSYVTSRINEIPKGVTVINPSLILCDDLRCFASRNGTAYYFDDDHLSIEGAKLVAKEIVKIFFKAKPS